VKRWLVKRWIVVATVAAVGFVTLEIYLAGRTEVPGPQAVAPVVLNRGLARGERVTSHSWSIDYDKITTSADQTFITADGVRNGIIFRHGKPYLRVRARHMTVNMVTHDFVASGPVHVESVSRHNFHAFDTTSAVWTEASQRLDLSEPIVITSPGASLHVQQLSLDVRTGALHIDQPHGSFRE
jgi:hypothetical protein